MLVYISGPMTKGLPHENIGVALHAAKKVFDAGHAAFTPQLSYFWHYFVEDLEHAAWLRLDTAIIEGCDAVLRILPHMPSKGADIEIAHAEKLGIPVFYTLANLLEFLRSSAVLH